MLTQKSAEILKMCMMKTALVRWPYLHTTSMKVKTKTKYENKQIKRHDLNSVHIQQLRYIVQQKNHTLSQAFLLSCNC